MSFILDALKKSESERQRQSGPALFEVKIAPPRSRFAVWGAVIGALLIINFVVVGVVLWRGSATRAAGPAAVTASGTMPAQAAAAPAAAEPRPAPQAEYRSVPSVASAPAVTGTVAAGTPAGTAAPAAVPPVQG